MIERAPQVPIRARRREALLDRLADHVLEHGLARATLRALAEAAGTSNRMLLYYFKDKNDLLVALLAHLAVRVMALVDLGPRRLPQAAMLRTLWDAARSPALAPYMRLFLELGVAAGRGEQPHDKAAAAMAKGFVAFVGGALDVGDADHETTAALILAQLDGLFVLRASGLKNEADAAADLMIARAGEF